jgi:hypothetical protein
VNFIKSGEILFFASKAAPAAMRSCSVFGCPFAAAALSGVAPMKEGIQLRLNLYIVSRFNVCAVQE